MPSYPLNKWSQLPRRWMRLIALLLVSVLISILIHPTTNAYAQESSTTDITNQAAATYTIPGGSVGITSNRIDTGVDPNLIDPLGDILGCNGLPLDSYAGFSVALYEPDASGLDLGELVSLAPTSGTDSIEPNIGNVNPFVLSANDGSYNFLFGDSTPLNSAANVGLVQTDAGARYILVINPPDDSDFDERRVLIEILGNAFNSATNTSTLSYQATSLDGQPISVDGATTLTETVSVNDAETQALTFFTFALDTAICEAEQISITKSADRSAAQPGDTVVYRLNIKNLAKAEVNSVVAIDSPPIGFEIVPESVTGQLNGSPIAVVPALSASSRSVSFSVDEAIAPDQVLDIIYAARLTPDAIRGTGRNSAIVTAQRTDSGFRVKDGPSTYRIVLDPGIFSDCGTLIGRVFEDKNFDGEQQSGEAGIPNAVIFLDDGNRVVTDADGLFSVQKMLPGQRTGTLDLSSLPGYTLAPNLYFSERNSYSRLVNLAPGGLVRMNFGVTPTFQEEQS
ncbi:MAG: hypothetical protein WBD47_04940 [Phormidesmis sp.]